GHTITFLDTPGHQAFTAMRARGAKVTDIAVIVVAADDGVMPQTVEAIDHAKAADVPVMVAVNKIDKEGADPNRVRGELAQQGLTPADWGGDTEFVDVSAKTKVGLGELLENLVTIAELEELKANPNTEASGSVIESRLDPGRELAGDRANRLKTEALARRQGVKLSLEDVFARAQEGLRELNLIVKADVAGSLEALADEIAKLPQDQVTVNIIHDAVGGINES